MLTYNHLNSLVSRRCTSDQALSLPREQPQNRKINGRFNQAHKDLTGSVRDRQGIGALQLLETELQFFFRSFGLISQTRGN